MLARVVLPDEAVSAGMDPQAFISSKSPDMPVFIAKRPDELTVPLPIRAGFELLKRRLHSGMPTAPDFSPLPVQIPLPKHSDVSAAGVQLLRLDHPVLVLVLVRRCVLGIPYRVVQSC
jgi:hypothetical protein